MKTTLRPFLLASTSVLLATASVAAQALPRSAPERQGVSSAALLDFVTTADDKVDSLHSVMILRHGHVVAEGWWTPYDAKTRHELYSLSKSFTSTAVGLAAAEGKLSLDDSVLETFKDVAPENPSANLKAMRLRDLLRMSAGHDKETSSAADAVSPKSFLAHPVPFKPGTHFLYNTPATFMASAMVQKATGQTVLAYLKPRLFDPLGIEDPTWNANFQGISLGGYGLSLKTEDIAKFGQLHLQKGMWNGKRLLPAEWVAEATARQTSNGSNPKSDWEQGYGYQFWRARHGAYRGDGAFGQYCVVIPEQDVVIAITSGVRDMQGVLNLIWDKILPGLRDKALEDDPKTAKALAAKLAGLSIRKPKGATSTPKLDDFVGKTYAFPKNERKLESIRLEKGESAGGLALAVKYEGRDEQKLPIGVEGWASGTLSMGPFPPSKTMTLGAWTEPDALSLRVVLVETPFVMSYRLKFDGDQLLYDAESNVRPKEARLVGKM